jgi:hypothetical protein
MTTPHGMPVTIDAHPNPLNNDREYGGHGTQCVYGETSQT